MLIAGLMDISLHTGHIDSRAAYTDPRTFGIPIPGNAERPS